MSPRGSNVNEPSSQLSVKAPATGPEYDPGGQEVMVNVAIVTQHPLRRQDDKRRVLVCRVGIIAGYGCIVDRVDGDRCGADRSVSP